MSQQMEAIFSALLLLAGFILVLFLAYWVTKLLGKRLDPGQRSRAIELLDRLPVGADRTLCIVRAADKTLLIGMTAHSMQTLAELDAERLPKPQKEDVSFSESLKSLMRQRTGPGAEGKEAEQHHAD